MVLVVVIVLFGGSRLASLGHGSGRHLRRTKDSLVDAGKGFRHEITGNEHADTHRNAQ
jgi:Sec-independent protein translocase protein TatA